MRVLTSGLIIGVLALVAYLFWAPIGNNTDPVERELKREKPIILQYPELSDYEENRLMMRIKARSARVFEKKKVTVLARIDGTFYSRMEDRRPTRVIADAGRMMDKSKLISVWGNVKVHFSDGQKLYTERLNLDQEKEQLYNKVAVKVLSGNDRIDASRMHYNMKTGVLVLNQPKAKVALTTTD